MAAARPSGEEEDISRRRSYSTDRRRSYSTEAYELSRYRSQYSDASAAHHRASSRARSRKSLGPPQGLARVPFEVKKFWNRQISVVVDQAYNRDHLGTETLYLPAILTVSLCLYVSGLSLWVPCTPGCVYPWPVLRCLAAFPFFISQGTGLDGGEATSAGPMLIVELVHPSTQRMTTPHYGSSMRTSLHTRALERTFLGYLRTSQALSMLGVIISQLFTIQKSTSPDPHIGYFVTGKPLGAICQGAAMLTLMLGTFRWWRQQNAITRGKALAGGFELTVIGLVILLHADYKVTYQTLFHKATLQTHDHRLMRTPRLCSMPNASMLRYSSATLMDWCCLSQAKRRLYANTNPSSSSPPARMAWTKSTRIIVMLVIDVAFFVLELGVGIWVGSLALMADAFHMLNDIISLLVGLWAVKAAQKSSSDKYSFGWLRAEILGAFFNAVFLIALCLSIILEAITRFVNIATITNPQLILIVGSLGLASNIVGFFVLGGHGHSHGPEEHAHGPEGHTHGDEVRSAEEGQIGADNISIDAADEAGRVVDVLPEAAVSRATRTPPRRSTDSGRERQLKFTSTDETASTSKGSDASLSLGRYNSNKSPRHKRSKFPSGDHRSKPQLLGRHSKRRRPRLPRPLVANG
ncbi:hypothetical protein V500_06535 [Pseudogymnoascus sp. VKM F-4518 (FW-2643)]|nr:hypothetical protein V500_06535 [Pseudogymnoascus sp. VKM F-4518 (FW-2643)]